MKYKLFSLLTAASLILGGCTDISDHRIVPETETTDTAEIINLIVPEHSVPAPEVIPEKREVSYRPADTDALHERLKDISAAREVTGMGIAVFRDGEIIYTDQLGYADRNLEKPVTRNTRFRKCIQGHICRAYPRPLRQGYDNARKRS